MQIKKKQEYNFNKPNINLKKKQEYQFKKKTRIINLKKLEYKLKTHKYK